MKIRVNPHNVEIIREQTEPINEKEIKVSKCEFEFDDNITNDFVKEAYFTLNGETYKQIIQNNECEYPSEVLDKKGTLEIGVVAYKVENEQEIQRYNPSPDYFESWVGSLKDAENTEPITPTDKEQMEQALQNGLNNINNKIDEVDEKLDGIETAIEETNNLNLDVSDKVDGDVTVTLTKKDASTKTVVISDGTSLQFMWQGTSLGIKTDDMEEYVFVDLQGIQGIKGDTGEPFTIKKTYSSVAEMNADFNNMEYGDYVMIASSVEVEDNAKLYTRGESQWIFITDFSGATGIRGPVGATPNIQIGSVTSGSTPSVTRTGTDENPVLNFVLQKGDKGNVGPTGPTGNGISSIEKTSTSGLVDTYTITYTNGNTTTYEVSNGEVTREELEEEVERLSMIYNAFPSIPGEVEEGSINGTAEVPFKEIGLKGNTSQESTTGKNLFNINATPNRIGGDTTYSVSGNTLNVSGKWFVAYLIDVEENKDYYVSADKQVISGASAGNIAIYSANMRTTISLASFANFTFNSRSNTQVNVVLYCGTNSEGEVNFSNLQFEKGTTGTSYEPYTGGNPAPNPDYPYPVNVVTGDNEVKVEGKNLFDGIVELGSIQNTTGRNEVSYNTIRSKDYIKVQSSTQYTFNNDKGYHTYLYEYDENKTILRTTTGPNSTINPMTFTTTATTKYIRFRTYGSNNEDDLTTKVWLYEGSTATTYEPYQSQTYPINLGSMELCKIGDYQDYIARSSGKNLDRKSVV